MHWIILRIKYYKLGYKSRSVNRCKNLPNNKLFWIKPTGLEMLDQGHVLKVIPLK